MSLCTSDNRAIQKLSIIIIIIIKLRDRQYVTSNREGRPTHLHAPKAHVSFTETPAFQRELSKQGEPQWQLGGRSIRDSQVACPWKGGPYSQLHASSVFLLTHLPFLDDGVHCQAACSTWHSMIHIFFLRLITARRRTLITKLCALAMYFSLTRQ